jgi:hypothetical protein
VIGDGDGAFYLPRSSPSGRSSAAVRRASLLKFRGRARVEYLRVLCEFGDGISYGRGTAASQSPSRTGPRNLTFGRRSLKRTTVTVPFIFAESSSRRFSTTLGPLPCAAVKSLYKRGQEPRVPKVDFCRARRFWLGSRRNRLELRKSLLIYLERVETLAQRPGGRSFGARGVRRYGPTDRRT